MFKAIYDDIERFAAVNGEKPYQVFVALIDYIAGWLDITGTPVAAWRYNEEQNKKFHGMLRKVMTATGKNMFSRECGWCDPFGDIFMQYLANKDLRGQCFTPDGAANLCARILDTFVGIKQVINDPACGSGRMLLAAAKLAEKRGEHIYVIGEDIDSVCVKQTAINLALHGIYGEVVCHDTLKDPDGIRFGYIVNELIYPDRLGRPSLRFSKDAGDFVCTKFWRCKRRAEPVQLTLF